MSCLGDKWGSLFGGLFFSPLSLFLCFCFPFLCVARGIGGLPLRRRRIPVLPFFPAPHPSPLLAVYIDFIDVLILFWLLRVGTCGAFSRMRVCTLSLMLSYHILGGGAAGEAGDLLVGLRTQKCGRAAKSEDFSCEFQKIFVTLRRKFVAHGR